MKTSGGLPSHAASLFRSIVHQRRTINRFQPGRTIPPNVLKDVLESSLRSPSSFNLQPTQIILVQTQSVLDEVANVAMTGPKNQYRTKDCSALAVFLSDLQATKRIDRVCQLEAQSNARHPAYVAQLPLYTSFLLGEGHAATALKQATASILSHQQAMPQIENIQTWSTKQTALMAQTFVLSATSHGLGTSIMEGLDGNRLKRVLRIPDRYHIPLVVAAGYEYDGAEDSDPTATPRLSLEEIVFADTFGEPYTGDEDGLDVEVSSA